MLKEDDAGNFIKEKDGTYKVYNEQKEGAGFDTIRENHSFNSALNILENREKYKKSLGLTDNQVDNAAVEAMAHSKSGSGVMDLNSRKQWNDCFNKIDAGVDAYNKDHPDSKISFDRSHLEKDDAALGQVASGTLALRDGDVSRDSGPEARSLSGDKEYVDKSRIDNTANSLKEEVADAKCVTRGENHAEVDSVKSRQVHVGEQNITENHTRLGENGKLSHEITVSDINSGKLCTQDAITDHIKEFNTQKDLDVDVYIKTGAHPNRETIDSYKDYKRDIHDTYGEHIIIHYDWER